MRGWLMCRYSARSFTLTSPILARRSRMRRRGGFAKARKWAGSSFRGVWRNIKVAFYASLTHKGGFMYEAAAEGLSRGGGPGPGNRREAAGRGGKCPACRGGSFG